MKNKIIIILMITLLPLTTMGLYKYQVKSQVVSVGTTATKIPGTPLVGRQYILIQNVGDATVYLGDSTVTADEAATGGIQITPMASWKEYFDHTVDVYGIVASGTVKVVVEEGK